MLCYISRWRFPLNNTVLGNLTSTLHNISLPIRILVKSGLQSQQLFLLRFEFLCRDNACIQQCLILGQCHGGILCLYRCSLRCTLGVLALCGGMGIYYLFLYLGIDDLHQILCQSMQSFRLLGIIIQIIDGAGLIGIELRCLSLIHTPSPRD